jgi:hypothetical protein
MRKVRDYDAELKALNERARGLKAKKVQQLGELVAVTGADGLDVETLAGALLAAIASTDEAQKEVWQKNGAAFFQQRTRKNGKRTGGDTASSTSDSTGDPTR